MQIKQVLYGLMTFVPILNRYKAKGTGGTDTARYCYSVWLRHLVVAAKHGLNHNPQTVAELGPGDSLGMGLAALITGSEKYYGFDVLEHWNVETNLKIFDELVELFEQRTDIPGDDEFPKVKPQLDDYAFPSEFLDEDRMRRALDPARLERIRRSIKDQNNPESVVQYKVPWYDTGIMQTESCDMIFSQAVLEHVDDIPNTYTAMRQWLKPDGYMTHTSSTWPEFWS